VLVALATSQLPDQQSFQTPSGFHTSLPSLGQLGLMKLKWTCFSILLILFFFFFEESKVQLFLFFDALKRILQFFGFLTYTVMFSWKKLKPSIFLFVIK
jgi:hypothetical protein